VSSTAVEITLPNSSTVWRIEQAGPDDKGDLSDAYSLCVGIAGAAQKMVEAANKVNDFSAELEWNAHALKTIEKLAPTIQQWSNANPPSTKEFLQLYETGIIDATPKKFEVRLWANGITDVMFVEDIPRVPSNYPGSYASMTPKSFYARPDGTYFYFFQTSPDLGPVRTHELNIDWDHSFIQPGPNGGNPDTIDTLMDTWVKSLSTVKDDLTKQSQIKMAYLQDKTSVFDSYFGFLQGLIATLKKDLETLIGK
jgi:hypothetical protein